MVPVEPLTVDSWINPPFSGHYDGMRGLTFPAHRLMCPQFSQENGSGVAEVATTSPDSFQHCKLVFHITCTHMYDINCELDARTTVETLLEHGFEPTRTIVLAYGIDEERGGISVSLISNIP